VTQKTFGSEFIALKVFASNKQKHNNLPDKKKKAMPCTEDGNVIIAQIPTNSCERKSESIDSS